MEDQRTLFKALLGDGRPFLSLTGTALCGSGAFAIFQSWSGHLLPHDSQTLGMDAEALIRASNHHLLMFMFHDRVAFGGTLLAIGTAYWWLAEFPLREREPWAWWAFAISGFFGFASFLSYLGYGYLDSWHGAATIALLPIFLLGLWRSAQSLPIPLNTSQIWHPIAREESPNSRTGRYLITACAGGLIVAGITIMGVGMTTVFVPQDLDFIGLTRDQIASISPHLVPVIAHDRAGFGGGLLSCGLLLAIIMRHTPLTRSSIELLWLVALFGFGAALGVHGAIGYTDTIHLAPAYAGLIIFLVGIWFCSRGRRQNFNQ
jgi:hypothetical protein